MVSQHPPSVDLSITLFNIILYYINRCRINIDPRVFAILLISVHTRQPWGQPGARCRFGIALVWPSFAAPNKMEIEGVINAIEDVISTEPP